MHIKQLTAKQLERVDWRPQDPDKTEIGQVNLVPG
jgi:hypothetical protein